MRNHDKKQVALAKFRRKNPIDNAKGGIGAPILLYVLGVPGVIVIVLWLFFF